MQVSHSCTEGQWSHRPALDTVLGGPLRAVQAQTRCRDHRGKPILWHRAGVKATRAWGVQGMVVKVAMQQLICSLSIIMPFPEAFAVRGTFIHSPAFGSIDILQDHLCIVQSKKDGGSILAFQTAQGSDAVLDQYGLHSTVYRLPVHSPLQSPGSCNVCMMPRIEPCCCSLGRGEGSSAQASSTRTAMRPRF